MIQELSIEDNATDLVDKLNHNFSEVSEGTPAGTVDITLKMYGGKYSTDDGLPAWIDSLTSTATFLRYFHSGLIKTKGRFEIDQMSNSESLYVLGYDDNFSYVGYSNSTVVPTGATYIRLVLENSSNYPSQRTFKVTFPAGTKVIKDCHVKEDMYRFTFEVEVNPDKQEPSSPTAYGGINERHYDLGMVYLPTNYDPEGEPVPLILYCHGTNGYKWGNYPNYGPQLQWDEFHKFCCYNGYAIADCSGMTDKYCIPISGNAGNPDAARYAMGNPLLVNCILQLYSYLVEVYNFRKDGVYAIARSTGGKTAFLLPYVAPFKVRAVAGLAPGISVINSCRHCQEAELRFVLRRFGYENPQVDRSMGTDGSAVIFNGTVPGDVTYVLANIHNFDGWDALFAGTELDVDTMARMMWAHNYIGSEQDYSDVLAIAAQTPKYGMAPSKIFISKNDSQTPYWHVVMFQKMVKKGNGICHIRLLPDLGTDANSHGSHYSMDLHTNAPKCVYKTKYKGTITITVGYAETIDWFNQW